MDARPVIEPKSWPSWKLADTVAADTQGLVVSGLGALPYGRALLLKLDWHEPRHKGGGAWLRTLRRVAPITSAEPPKKTGAPRGGSTPPDDQHRAAALGIGWAGLQLMGLGDTALASFAAPFREGMMQPDRLRRLGDRRGGKWQPTVIAGGPVWSANTPERHPVEPLPAGFDVPSDAPPETKVVTQQTAHAILLLYTRDEQDAIAWTTEVTAALLSEGVVVERTRDLVLDALADEPFSREHFGFADGLSQPAPYDEAGAVILSGRPLTQGSAVQGVPLGEILFGYENGHREPAPGPVVPASQDGPAHAPDPSATLPVYPLVDGFFDLGRNGSYLVVRELKQDVAGFWTSMDRNARRLSEQDPTNNAHITSDWIADRVIGRDRDGHLLFPTGRLAPDKYGLPDNDYLFWDRDRHGIGCPLGSHVRRANPRDSLAPTEDQKATLLRAANNHRILRRGRKYGPAIRDDRTDDGQDRGLLFMCLNTDIARQFEFVQQTWLLNATFATLYQEVDPLLGPPGPMTIAEKPLRRIVEIETYVQLVGGEYFFLPSLSALDYLSSL